MAVYIITGKLGGGKTLVSVGMIRDALQEGRKVATNIDLKLENLLPWQRKNVVAFRLPDKLTAESFEMIGHGNPDKDGVIDEDQNGLLVLDEGGLALNSRDYREEGRKDFIKWGIHSRKNGWDMAIVIQHIDALDKQVRDLFGEHVVTCSRLDKMRIPMFGWILQLVGFKGTMGKVHKATCRYGQQSQAVQTWVKWYQGKDLYDAFNTRQTFDPNDGSGVRQYLSPYLIKGRYHSRNEEIKDGLKNTWQIYALAKVGRLSVFFSAMLLGGWSYAQFTNEDAMTVQAAAVEPFEQVAAKIESEEMPIEVEKPIDPWDHAYISSYVGNNKTGTHKYKFRAAGLPIDPPLSSAMIPVSRCAVILKTDTKIYEIYCKNT